MGRKIPGKKHRGVKDPEKQRSNRLNSLKGKVNAPPSNPDFQEVPHSINRIAELKEQFKNKKLHKNSKELFIAQQNNSQPSVQHKPKNKKKKDVAFKQLKGESDRHFLQRVYRACDSVIHEKAFENKYGVDIKRNPTTGEVEKLVKRPKDEIEQLMKNALKNKKRKKPKKSDEPVLTKSQKRQKKLNEKKQKKLLRTNDFATNRDVVKFGEVVHAPPTLSVPRKVAKLDGAPRPGERNLLLKSVLQTSKLDNAKKQASKSEDTTKKTINKVIDKSGKRKNLPNALRRRLEKQQAEIIDAYRTLKKKTSQ